MSDADTARGAGSRQPVGRAVYKAAVRFAGVNVPVKVYAALGDTRVRFRLLHDEDASPLRQEMICPLHEEPVPFEHRVKGYEVAPDEYVVVDPAELRDLRPESERTIDVLEFVELEEVDPRFYDRPYYLGPDGKDSAFAALAAALERSGRTGVCRWIMRNRSYLGALAARDGVLVLTALRYADELVPIDQLGLPEGVEVREKERTTAVFLVRELEAPFEPGAHRDEYDTAVRELIRRKVEGEAIEIVEPEERPATEDDRLLETLERSLEMARGGRE